EQFSAVISTLNDFQPDLQYQLDAILYDIRMSADQYDRDQVLSAMRSLFKLQCTKEEARLQRCLKELRQIVVEKYPVCVQQVHAVTDSAVCLDPKLAMGFLDLVCREWNVERTLYNRRASMNNNFSKALAQMETLLSKKKEPQRAVSTETYFTRLDAQEVSQLKRLFQLCTEFSGKLVSIFVFRFCLFASKLLVFV
ncbi:hypothetical protein BVRB_034330, partial [Beta vulgaris subsp. vulgaris]